jgi:hypothetical protein
MHVEHSEFIIDKTKDFPYWRYMDFWKFLNLISTSKLFFPNVEMLGDQNEGRIPEKAYEWMVGKDKKLGRKDNFAENYKRIVEKDLRPKTLISSWTASKTESFAMWKMYAKDKLGIAIKTNFERLSKSFHQTDSAIYIGEVKYYDDENPAYKVGNTFYSFLVKNNYYEFESEVRCITEISDSESIATFKNIDIDLNVLIEEVYISPFAYETGIIEIIEFIKIKNNLDFKIKISGVNDKWI